MGHSTLIIPNESDPPVVESGKIGFRLRHKLYLLPSLEFREERTVRDCDFDNGGMRPVSPEVQFLVGTGVFRQDLGRNLDFGLLVVGCLADPMREAVVALVADRLEQ